MATYCMSDIHGHKLEFDIMLSKIRFSKKDQLYILGDIIDRGYESAEMLMWAVDKAPSNIHFMMGNHEDIAREVIKRDPYTMEMEPEWDTWAFNGGEDTADSLYDLTTPQWRASKLIPWLDALPVYKMVIVNNHRFMLVHAGFNPFRFEDSTIEEEDLDLATTKNHLREHMNIGYGFGQQSRNDMLWIREDWIYDYQRAPVTTIHGHTPTNWTMIDGLVSFGIQAQGGPGMIMKYMNKIDIDCGCAHDDGEAHALGCLRLDDLKEFYVPIIPDERRFELSIRRKF